MIKKIFNFFGYTLLPNKEFKDFLEQGVYIEKKADALILEHKRMFDFNSFKPQLTYEEFCALNNLEDKTYRLKFHNLYWRDQYEAQHIAVELRKLSLTPDLLRAFLQAFAAYDWNKTAEYMKKTGWKYSGNENTPTIEDLQYTVISLIPHGDFSHPENTCMSGGFEVTVNYVDGKPNCKIKFKEDDVFYLR